jgi:hypothetical protein
VLPVVAIPAGTIPGAGTLRVERWIARWQLIIDGARHHLVFVEDDRALQLCVVGSDLREPIHLLADAIPHGAHFAARMLGLRRLGDLQSTHRLRPGLYPPHPRSRRLSLVLSASDLRRQGASSREIAFALFGSAKVEQDWNDPGDHLRDQVRRAVQRGRALANGGYKRLLA